MASENESANPKDFRFQGLVSETHGKLKILRLNTPKKKNALTSVVYEGLAHHLKEAAEDPNITVVALTGTGDFYSSGNDFSAAMQVSEGDESDLDAKLKGGIKATKDFITALIDFPKVLVAVLNGPAVGIAVTTLGLCDFVYAVDTAWLHTPFSQLGLCPEGCSSVIFPRLMGTAKASELLLFGKKITAKEAESLGLVTEVLPASSFSEVWSKLAALSKLPRLSLMYGKKLCRATDRELLHQVNRNEMEHLAELSRSEETINAMLEWFSRRRSNL